MSPGSHWRGPASGSLPHRVENCKRRQRRRCRNSLRGFSFSTGPGPCRRTEHVVGGFERDGEGFRAGEDFWSFFLQAGAALVHQLRGAVELRIPHTAQQAVPRSRTVSARAGQPVDRPGRSVSELRAGRRRFERRPCRVRRLRRGRPPRSAHGCVGQGRLIKSMAVSSCAGISERQQVPIAWEDTTSARAG